MNSATKLTKIMLIYLFDIYQEGVIRVDVPLPNVENALEVDSVLTLAPCYSQCLATMPRKELCTTLSAVTEFDISLTFWLYLSIRVFISMISGTAFAMFEGIVQILVILNRFIMNVFLS